MKLKKLFIPISNPYIGPIFVISIFLSIIIFYLIPKHSYENKVEHMSQEALKTLNYLKKIRVYYTSSVVDKVEGSSIKVDYNYKQNYHTIPLAATLVHDLALILPTSEMQIKMYSNYPFPNRAKRVLSDFEKESLAFLIKNPEKVYIKDIQIENKHSLRVAVADIMLDNSCVECHNSRSDSPKKDWKIDDVRGVIEVNIPFEEGVLLNTEELNALIYIFVFVLVSLGLHYIVIAIIRSKDHNRVKEELEKEVEQRTTSLNSTVKLLNQYKKAVDISTIVSKTDIKGKITYVNDEFEKISQYRREELLGKNHNIVRHSDMPQSTFKDMWQTIRAKKIWKGQIKNRAKDGSSYYVATTIVPILNYKDEIEEFLAIRFNITDIINSKLEAQKADETKSIFLANMSHEIRTPLNAIIGFSDILSKSKNLTSIEKKQAAIIETSANSLLEIINDILDISKIESGNFEVALEEGDLYYVCEHVVELFSKKAAQKNIKLIFNMDSKIPLCLMTDSVRLRQVLSNLLSNAIKFTPEEGVVTLNISLEGIEKGFSVIKFEVEDSGIGIPKDKLDTIFTPFIQVDNKTNRKFDGTGLGLSISKHIIESLGSSIEVDSQVDKFTKFSFSLRSQICTKTFNNRSTILNKINFKVINEDSFIYFNIKRYLALFGEINGSNDSENIIVCDEKSIKEVREEYKDTPKIILFEYENSLYSFELKDSEIALSLPFYASKVNDALEELLKKSKIRVFEPQINPIESIDEFSGKILVAEDNIANQELIAYMLNEIGIEFDIKENGLKAFEAYKAGDYKLVLMDINMPVMDGVEAFNKIREYEKDNKRSNTPIIALTANSIKGDKEKFLHLGMDDYLSKPINNEQLLKMFRRYLNLSILKEDTIKETNYEKGDIKIDLQKIVDKLGVSQVVATLIANKFKNEIMGEVKELELAIKEENSEHISQRAHYVRNSCLNVCLDELCAILQKLEDKSLNRDEATLIFDELLQRLKKYI